MTPIYSDTPTFSEWTLSEEQLFEITWQEIGGGSDRWMLAGPSINECYCYEPYDAVRLEFNDGNDDYTATRTRTDILGYTLGSQSDKPLASEGEAEALRIGKADKSDVDPLLFAQYYPDGDVKSSSEFTSGIKYDAPDTASRTITVKPFCNTGTAENDNSNLVGRVVIPPFVDSNGNGYITDNGMRFKVVGVSGGSLSGTNTDLTAIVVPNTVTTVGDFAFCDCNAIISISFPAVASIGSYSFIACSALTSISLPVATTIGDGAIYNCPALISVSLPTATTIVDRAFMFCTGLTSVSLPTATSIGTMAFRACNALSSIDFGDMPRPSVPSLSIGAFAGVPTSCKIVVPYTQYDAWTAADVWKDLPQEFVRHAEKADKPATFITGNLAKFDINGNLVDTEISTDEIVTESEFEPVANREFLMISSNRQVALAKDAVESAYPVETSHNATTASSICYGFSLNLKSYFEELARSEVSEIAITKVRLQSITVRLRNLTNLAKLAVKETGTSDVLALSDPLQLRDSSGGLNFTFLFTDDVVLPADKRYDFYVVDASSGDILTGSRMGTVSTTKITGFELLNNDGTRSSYNGAWGGGITADCIGLASIRIATETDLFGYVPTSRTVNGKALSSDLTLSAADVGALPITGGTLSGSLEVTGFAEISGDVTIHNGLVVTGFTNSTAFGLGDRSELEIHADTQNKKLVFVTASENPPVQSSLKPDGFDVATLKAVHDAIKQIAPAWVSGTTYAANALVTYNGVVYHNTWGGTFVSDIPPSSDTNWEATPVSDLLLPVLGGEMIDDLVMRDGGIKLYGNSSNYWEICKDAQGIYLYNGTDTYFLVTDTMTGGGTFALTAPNPIADNLAALDANGNPVDSGIGKDAVVTNTILSGETMPSTPTQNELAEAVKKIFTALGGTVTP